MSPIERSAGGGGSTGGLTLIFDQIAGGAVASIDTGAGGVTGGFHAILVVGMGRSTGAVFNDTLRIVFNNDTAAHYDFGGTENSGGAVISLTDFADTVGILGQIPGTSTAANYVGTGQMIMPSYDQTTFFKVGATQGGLTGDAAARVTQSTGQITYRSAAAITRLAISTGANLVAGSRLTVWGL